MKVLIIEDDAILANVYRNKFTVERFQVEIAPDGQAGFEMLRSFRPDAVILDLTLPKVSGIELMRQIRAEPGFEKMPIIVFSNTYLTNMVEEAWKAGATKCLSKVNCTPKDMVQLVRSTLEGIGGAKVASDANIATTAEAQSPGEWDDQSSSSSSDTDAEFQAELRGAFLADFPTVLVSLRSTLQALVKADSEAAKQAQMHELYRRVHAVTGNAGVSGMTQMAQMCDAFEALLKELQEKPVNINASTLRTVASTIDFLAILFERDTAEEEELPPARALVVDDEAISRRAVVYALNKARLKSVNVEDPVRAFQMLTENQFDLVLLDVDMPNMNGYELCTKIRTLPTYKKTPVIFVTGLTDFESRANSTMSGGNDFIAKPFLFMELAVKALMYVLRSRLDLAKR